MKPDPFRLFLCALATLLIFGGCSVQRSRTLGDDRVAAHTLAEQVCASCHGTGGNASVPTFPKLAGQQKAYLMAQLTEYRAHTRSDADAVAYMWGVAAHLSNAQIEELAAYYQASPPLALPVQTTVPATLVAGGTLYQQGDAARGIPACASCHGSSAEGSATFPRLAGQHAAYVVKQLKIFQVTDQRPEGAVMKGVAHALTPADVQAVALYIAGL